MAGFADHDIVWRPSPEWLERANLTRFARIAGLEGAPYEQLHRWSVAEPGAFWAAVWDSTGVIGTRGGPAMTPAPDSGMLGTRW
ncbi:MAG: acetoacetate--CoA ligase, partial [Pseudomonadota bacterium]|nr:acetoacetate--CoA ligase [Pseudomonadota bacterium]